MKQTCPTEYQEQCTLVDYLEILKKQGKVRLFTALPNNTYTKSWSQKRKQTAEGVRKGFPDLCVIIKQRMNTDNMIFIEMKRKKGGILRPEQREWQEAINGTVNHFFICRGYEEAKKVVDQFIENI
jgi:hypothetical protein